MCSEVSVLYTHKHVWIKLSFVKKKIEILWEADPGWDWLNPDPTFKKNRIRNRLRRKTGSDFQETTVVYLTNKLLKIQPYLSYRVNFYLDIYEITKFEQINVYLIFIFFSLRPFMKTLLVLVCGGPVPDHSNVLLHVPGSGGERAGTQNIMGMY